MIPSPSKDKFTFIFNRENAAPRYFEIERRKLITYLTIVPTGFLILFFGLMIARSLTKQLYVASPVIPSVTKNHPVDESDELKKSNQEKETLKLELAELQKANKELANKLVNDPKNTIPLQDLSFFSSIPGQKDLSSTPSLTINEIKISEVNNEIHFHANLLNTGKGENSKISGHLFIMMKTDNSFYFYPSDAIPQDKLSSNFNNGEAVLFARLRPIDANFPKPNKKQKILFKVFLFSRSGDLLHKEIFPYDSN